MRATTSTKGGTTQCLRKLGIHLAQDPAVPLLGIHPKDTPSYHRDNSSTIYIASLITVSRNGKQPKCSSRDEWKENVHLHLHYGMLLRCLKKNEIMKF